MVEENQQSQTAETSTTADSPETLDQVYKAFNVEETATEFRQHQPAPQQRPAPQHNAPSSDVVPDPVMDPAGYKEYAARTSQETREALRNVSATVAGLAAQQARQQETADISAAVSAVKSAGFEAEDDFIEIALGQKVRKDAKFLAIYQNRQKNPAAWGRALSAFANEAKGKFSFKADPELAANVRAAKASTSSTQAASPAGTQNALDKHLEESKDPREFAQRWDQIVRGGSY